MVEIVLRRRLTLLLAAIAWSGSALMLPVRVSAETPLTRAVVQSIRNSVRLLLLNQSPRNARVRDAMAPGDALATARRSLAELRFNDGSLARVGEQALFQFLPNTRSFRLSNGTVLLLIPPGRGNTRLQTPNAVAGIRGSALFVRYVPETDTTIVGALTTSGIEVTNGDRTQNQPLNAGQMAVIVQNQIQQVYNFDLRTFYETSDLVKDLNLSGREPVRVNDPAISAVQEETTAAVNAQTPITGANTANNPSFLNSAQANQSPTPSDLTILQPSTVSRPLIIDSPTNIFQLGDLSNSSSGQSGNSSTRIGTPSGLIGNPGRGITGASGLIGTPPGLPGNTPGQNGSGPPVLTGTAPGLSGNTPGQNGSGPPGLTGTAPGLSGNTPGQNGSGPPGLTGTAPGLAGTTPGQGGSGPPGLTGTAPGLAGTNPGQSNSAGQKVTPPGLAGTNPGRGGQ